MKIDVIPVGIDQRQVVRNLFQFYLYDSSDWESEDIGTDGLFYVHDPYFNQYWDTEGWSASLVKVDDAMAGFLLIERSDIPGIDAPEFADFFVLKRFRRQGVGRRVVESVIADSASAWVVNVFEEDENSNAFWHSLFRSSLFRSVRELKDPHGRQVRAYLINEQPPESGPPPATHPRPVS
jgi:predicted acetyltransferase